MSMRRRWGRGRAEGLNERVVLGSIRVWGKLETGGDRETKLTGRLDGKLLDAPNRQLRRGTCIGLVAALSS